MFGAFESMEATVLLFIQNNLRCSLLDAVMQFFSAIGTYGLLWIAIGVILLCSKKHRYAGVTMLFCLLCAWCVTELLIKNIVQRPRPFNEIEGLIVVGVKPTSWSFPSGHTSSSFACAYALTKTYRKYGAWAYVPASLIALSRLYLGVHYPSDVICSAIIATILAAIMFRIRVRYIRFPRQSK